MMNDRRITGRSLGHVDDTIDFLLFGGVLKPPDKKEEGEKKTKKKGVKTRRSA